MNSDGQRAFFSASPIPFEPGDESALLNPELYAGEFASALYDDGVYIGMDDGGNAQDMDGQDFVVYAEVIPESTSILGLMVFGASALKLRRRNDA